MFHRDRPENLHLVCRVSGVDGRKNRINLLPTSTLMERNENAESEAIVDAAIVTIKKKRNPSVGIRAGANKRSVCEELTNIVAHQTQAKTPRHNKVHTVFQCSGDLDPMKKAALASVSNSSKKLFNLMVSPQSLYNKSTQFVVGTLLTYDDTDSSEEVKTKEPPMTSCYQSEQPKPIDVSFAPPVCNVLHIRISFTIAWLHPGYPDDDLPSASLAAFVLQGFVSKRSLIAGVMTYLKLCPTSANEFHLYDCALRGTPSYLMTEGTLEFNCNEDSMRCADMIHDFATFAANRLLNLPALERSCLSTEEVASFYSVVADWKEAVHSLF
jgi:hypothetical protein